MFNSARSSPLSSPNSFSSFPLSWAQGVFIPRFAVLASLSLILTLFSISIFSLSFFTVFVPTPAKKLNVSDLPRQPSLRLHAITFPNKEQSSLCVNVVSASAPLDDGDPYNSRSFCMYSSPICVSSRTETKPGTLYFSGDDIDPPPCYATPPSLDANLSGRTPTDCYSRSCAVHCAHGAHHTDDSFPECATIKTLPSSKTSANHEWTKGDAVLIVIPAYPFQANIFHFSQTIIPVFHTLSVIPTNTAVAILFRGSLPEHDEPWQAFMLQALMAHVGLKMWTVDTLYENDIVLMKQGLRTRSSVRMTPRTICSERTILLGHRTHTNVWPFPGGDLSLFWPFSGTINPKSISKTVSRTLSTVPALSMHVRAAVFNHIASLPPTLRNSTATSPDGSEARWYSQTPQSLARHFFSNLSLKQRPDTVILDLPPRVLLYVRRDPSLTVRVFSNSAERWMYRTLSRTCRKYGWTLRTLLPDEESVTDQLLRTGHSGVLVGLHGANLVNSMFAPALGALMEIGAVPMQCYIAGMNAGLGYWHVKVTAGNARESKCEQHPREMGCEYNDNWRMIKLDSRAERRGLEQSVKESIQYVERLYEAFGEQGGIKARYKLDRSDEYEVVWDGNKR